MDTFDAKYRKNNDSMAVGNKQSFNNFMSYDYENTFDSSNYNQQIKSEWTAADKQIKSASQENSNLNQIPSMNNGTNSNNMFNVYSNFMQYANMQQYAFNQNLNDNHQKK